jgi:Sec7-like guanine-nucleotide exchange factor
MSYLLFVFSDFLWNFRLPGEAQKIDRMMDCFSQRFYECNLNIFPDAGN